MIKKYYLMAEISTLHDIEVEANSEEEAIEIATATDLNGWLPVEDTGFEITKIMEINDEH